MSKWSRVVNKAILRNKESIVYVSKGTGTYNTSTGTSSSTSTSYTLDAARALTKITSGSYPNIVSKDSTAFYIEPSAFVPKVGDSITAGSETFSVVKYEGYHAGGALVMYILYT